MVLTAKEDNKIVLNAQLVMPVHPRQMTSKFSALQAIIPLDKLRLVFLVLLVPSVQTLHHPPSSVQMDLTVWVLQLPVLIVQLVMFVRIPPKVQFHCLVLQGNTVTNQPLRVQNAMLDMLVKAQIFLRHLHQDYVHWVSTALMVNKN